MTPLAGGSATAPAPKSQDKCYRGVWDEVQQGVGEGGGVGVVAAPLQQSPDPPILAFLEKARVFPQKARVFLFAEPLKSLEKRGKTHKKARKIGKRKKQGNRKKQGLEGQGLEIAERAATGV